MNKNLLFLVLLRLIKTFILIRELNNLQSHPVSNIRMCSNIIIIKTLMKYHQFKILKVLE